MAKPSMRSSGAPTRQRLAALAAVVLLPLLAACTASFGAETSRVHEPGTTVSADSGPVKIRGFIAVAPENGRATLAGTMVIEGGSDTLTAVTLPRGEVLLDPTPVGLPAGEVVRFGSREPGSVSATLIGPSVVQGLMVPLTFRFAEAAPVQLDVLVVPRRDAWDEVPLPAQPAPPQPAPQVPAPQPEGPDGSEEPPAGPEQAPDEDPTAPEESEEASEGP